MQGQEVAERDTAIVAALAQGVRLRTVCAIFNIDALTVRRVAEAAGQSMPVDLQGPGAIIAERETEMLRRALGGEDFTVIGKAHDVSREWVRQVVKKHTGLSAKDLQSAREAARHQFKVQRLRDEATDANLRLDDLAERSGLTVREVETVLGPAEAARRRRGRNVTTAMERGQILTDLARVAALPGGSPLSGPFYDRNREDGLSSARIVQVFGAWSTACEAAGVEAPSAPREKYDRGWSREDCLRWVLDYLQQADRPTAAGYEQWARDRDGAPSGGTVRLRCGKWIETVSDAYSLETGHLEPRGPVGEEAAAPNVAGGSTTDAHGQGTDEGPDANDAPTDPSPMAGQGRESDPEVRLAVEMAAQQRLMRHYEVRGWKVVDTHLGAPYDAVAMKGSETMYLEAKGTQSAGTTVLVTRGEVEHALKHPGQCVIGVWSGMKLDHEQQVLPDSGAFRVMPFQPEADDLTVVGYEWRPPQ
ncbi:DUF3883 domain-containing protein [Nocardioides sp. GY 10113]|uniref:protein NO VEIN domain-containing protein n=1 Tax=Nocardioides sp. GY 10113 TaxID=2569761 RepID=UPI0010A8FC38|nr:DUF3883 domain-containing protein [Nocardioides sp. GY 10113]TIC83618.1 DUF3883 domain-containing protein [Nocardioides sp. GY 10113]